MNREPKPDFERYLTALHCQEPDRVPLGDWHVDPLVKEAFLGRPVDSLGDLIEFWRLAGYDFVTASAGILEPVRAPEGMTTKGEAVRTEYGRGREREWALEHEGMIATWEQFERYPWPTADEFDYSQWGFLDAHLPRGMKAVLLLGKIYTTVWMYMGAERFFQALEEDPELIEAMFEKVGRIQYETFLRVIEHPCLGAVLNPDDIAHNLGLLVHPKHLRRYVFPWYEKMGRICRDKGLGWIFHSDGDCTEAMDDLIDCHFHGFNPIQPNAMDIVEVKRQWGDRLCLIGNLNLDSTLTLGSPKDVRAEVYERIRQIGPGGGFMVASSNSVTDYVPLENFKAMVEATFEFGRYPLDLREGGVAGKVWTYSGKGRPAGLKEAVDRAAGPKAAPLAEALLAGEEQTLAVVGRHLAEDLSAGEVIGQGLIPALTLIGRKFQNAEIYIPEMMLAAKAMLAVIEKYEPEIAGRAGEDSAGTVVIGTVSGDLHDIGKNLVAMILKGQGFKVIDLGVSVETDRFVRAVTDHRPDVLAMSALLTTTMVEMKATIDSLTEAGLRDKVRIIVGGAPVTQDFAQSIGADGYAYDAPGASRLCLELAAERGGR